MGKLIGICVVAIAAVQPAWADQAPWSVSERALSCPGRIRAGEPIAIQLASGGGHELAARRAEDGAWFFLVVGSPPKGHKNLLDPSELARRTHLQIPADFTQARWESGAKPEKVFRPGHYELYLSENLESEDGGFKCSFKVTGLSPNNSSKPTPLRGAA